jgi:hypothetical protein
MVLGDISVLDCNNRVMLSHVGVLEETAEWCLATLVFFRGNIRVILSHVGVLEITAE